MSTDDEHIKAIQGIYEKFGQEHKFIDNILSFPTALSSVGLSILDDAEYLLRRRGDREVIEERLLCVLQDIATEIINSQRKISWVK